MRKLFFLIPAMLLALTANAKVVQVYPTTPNSTDNIRRAIRDNAVSGDTIMLMSDDAMYDESSDYMILDKDVTILPAEGKHPVIKMSRFAELKSSAKVVFKDIKFDGSEAANTDRGRCLRPYDTSAGKIIKFENCEFYGFKSYVIYCGDSYNLDSCIINNCYFHNNDKHAIYFAKSTNADVQTAKGIIITNSTFTTSGAGGSVIEVCNQGTEPVVNDVELTVDHCTFYDNQFGSSSHAPIRASKLGKLSVTNCIFAQPTSCTQYATYGYGGVVDHCLVFNLNGHRDYDSHPTITNNITADPLFTDAANYDLTLKRDYTTGEVSPAYGAGTNGSNLGDPRWHTSGTYYTTDFADPGYNFTAAKAVTIGAGIEVNEHYGVDNPYLRYTGSTPTSSQVTWVIKATRACHVDVTINMANNEWEGKPDGTYQNGKHIFGVELWDENNVRKDTVAEGLYENGSSLDGYSTYPTVNLGSLDIPEAGVYTVKLLNCRSWSKCGVSSITMTYSGGDTIQMPGIATVNDAWFSPEGTRANGYIDFPNSTIQNGWVKWNVLFNKTSSYKAIVKINATSGHNYTVKLYRDENDQEPITFANGAQYSQKGEPVELEIEPQLIESGSYILEVVNGLQNSDAQLISVQFVRQGGGLVDVPGAINFEEAIFSTYAWLNESGATDTIHFARANHEEYAADADYTVEGSQYVKWRVNVTKSGKYQFVANTYCKQGHNYRIMLLSEDETSTIQSQQEVPGNGHAWNSQGADLELKTDVWELAKGNYVLKMQARELGRLMSLRGNYLGGAVDTIPGTIDLADALLSDRAYRDNDGLHFTDADHYSTIANESATWNIYAIAGVYDFTLNVVGTNHGIYQLIVKDSQNNEVATKEKGKSGSGSVEIKSVFFPADGNYTIRLANVNNYADGYLTALSAAKQDVVVLDEAATNNSVLTANYNVTKNFILKRTFKGGMYNTICLPFEIGSQGTMESIFGVGYELVKLSDATISPEGVLTVEVENSVTLEHGVPYFIKPAADIVNPVFNNRKIKDTEMSDFSRGDVDFVGTFIKDEIPASEYNLFLGENNLLYFPMANTPIKGYRAYFRINNPNSAPVRQARIVTREQVITEIDLVGEENHTVKTIENGQLIIIKNGIRYNVMGAKIQ